VRCFCEKKKGEKQKKIENKDELSTMVKSDIESD